MLIYPITLIMIYFIISFLMEKENKIITLKEDYLFPLSGMIEKMRREMRGVEKRCKLPLRNITVR